MEQQPCSVILFDDRPFLLHQHRRNNLFIIPTAAGDEGDDGGLKRSQAGVISSGLNVRAFKNIPLGIEKRDAGGGRAVGRVRVIGGLQRRNRKSVEMIVLGKRESVVTRLQEERDGFGEKVVGAEVVGEEVGERAEVRVFMGGDEDLDVGGVAEFLKELAAMAAGGGGDGEGVEVGLDVVGHVGEEELFGVDGVVEGEAGELHVHAHEDATGGAESDGGDGKVGDGRTGEGLSRGNEGREEFGD